MPSTLTTTKPLFTSQPNVVADVAGLTCVGRIHRYNFHAFLESFVFKERSKLIERPTIRASTFCLIAWLLVRSVSNPRQVLNCNNRALRFGGCDDSFANAVVQLSLIAPLASRQPPQDVSHSTARGSCAFRDFGLKRRSDLGKSISDQMNSV